MSPLVSEKKDAAVSTVKMILIRFHIPSSLFLSSSLSLSFYSLYPNLREMSDACVFAYTRLARLIFSFAFFN